MSLLPEGSKLQEKVRQKGTPSSFFAECCGMQTIPELFHREGRASEGQEVGAGVSPHWQAEDPPRPQRSLLSSAPGPQV